MFSNYEQIRQYLASNQVVRITHYPDQTLWCCSIDTARKRRFIQKKFHAQLMADSLIAGIPVVNNGKWPNYTGK